MRTTAEEVGAARRGAVVVGAVRGGESAFHGAGEEGAGPGTLFEIGSVSKTFTALALARLAVRGTVALTEPLADLLPPGTAVPERQGARIELAHLACHTSGLPRLPKGMMPRVLLSRSDPYARCTAEALLAGLRRTRLRSAPGERFHYSNLGGGLLGLALARRAGGDYDALIRAEICEPLGLADTRVVLDTDRASRLVRGHSRRGQPRPYWRLADLAGAGGVHSTAADLITLARTELDAAAPGAGAGGLAEAIRLTHSEGHPTGGGATAHLGLIGLNLAAEQGGHRVLFHNGGTGGFSSLLALAPERHAAVVVLSATAQSVDQPGLALLARLAQD